MSKHSSHRLLGALLCLGTILANAFPGSPVNAEAANDARAVALLNTNSCSATPVQVAQGLPTPEPAPTGTPNGTTATPTPSAPPFLDVPPVGPQQIYITPRPSGVPETPLPVPTASPKGDANSGPVFLIRSSGSPGPLTPAGGSASPSPSAQPTAAGPTPLPTLQPGYIAVFGDQIIGNSNEGQPQDIIGHVQILYADEVVAGEKAHFDGARTIAVTGNPYVINHAKNSILHGDVILFDTIAHTAEVKNARGESTEDVERGEVYFNAKDLESDSNGVAHGSNASVTTCSNPRGGYHLTGRTIDVTPGDKITITKAILFLGAAAIFYLPKVVIPLRSVDEVRQPTFFPEVGYDAYQGYYVKAKLGFGKDQYYEGYYRVEYFTKVGLGLGYVAYFARRNNKRQSHIDYYGIKNRQTQTQQYNLEVDDKENFSPTLVGNAAFSYNGNYGQYLFLPPSTSLTAQLAHATASEQQTYSFNGYAVGSQSRIQTYNFADTRQITKSFSQTTSLGFNSSSTNYGGTSSSTTTDHFNTVSHLVTPGYDYQLTVDKSNSTSFSGVNKEPELQIRPSSFFPHFLFPITANFAVGSYSEPQNAFSTSRADLSFQLGPALYHVFGSDFSASGTLEQFAYGTGDLKATISQHLSLQTPIGKHFLNSIDYNESNNNGPASVPFQFLDNLIGINSKAAYETLRIFNGDVYNLLLSTSTSFNEQAQPVSYQLTSRPSRRSLLTLGGSFVPGIGQGFTTTNLQLASPFGRDADVQFLTDIDWKNHGRLTNKNIYYHRIIGDCYEIRVQYNENLKQVNITLNLLAFPSRAASFGVNRNGPILPGGLNF